MRRQPPRRPSESSPGVVRRVVIGLALFLVLCGVALFAFGGDVGTGPEPEPQPERRSEPVTRRALRHAEEAERALMDRDYGRARERVRDVRRLLANLEREHERRVASGESTSSEEQE